MSTETMTKDWVSSLKGLKEIWMEVPGLESHVMVSNFGRVYHKIGDFISWGWLNNTGYLMTEIADKDYLIHRLVALTFIPNPQKKPFVNHKNGDTTNPAVYNLEWSTPSENTLHSYQVLNRTVIRGEDHARSKISNENVELLRVDYSTGNFTQEALATKYGISRQLVSLIVNNQRHNKLTHYGKK